MDFLAPLLTQDRQLTVELMGPASREPDDAAEKDSPVPTVFKAVEALLKGFEIPALIIGWSTVAKPPQG
jgi:hypothetical protein